MPCLPYLSVETYPEVFMRDSFVMQVSYGLQYLIAVTAHFHHRYRFSLLQHLGEVPPSSKLD